MSVLELDIPDAVHVDVVLRQVHQRERLVRTGIGVPGELEHAPMIEGHDGDAGELRRRHIGRPASSTAHATATRPLTRRRRRSDWRLPLTPSESWRSYDTRRSEQKLSSFHSVSPLPRLAGIIVGRRWNRQSTVPEIPRQIPSSKSQAPTHSQTPNPEPTPNRIPNRVEGLRVGLGFGNALEPGIDTVEMTGAVHKASRWSLVLGPWS